MRFFDQADRQGGDPIPYSAPRAITGSVQRLNLGKAKARVEKRPPLEWQTAAWRYYDTIGEVHYAVTPRRA